jgi:hypothetical protein
MAPTGLRSMCSRPLHRRPVVAGVGRGAGRSSAAGFPAFGRSRARRAREIRAACEPIPEAIDRSQRVSQFASDLSALRL